MDDPAQHAKPTRDTALEAAVDRILAHCGPRVVAAAPLGLGKPNRLLNALYRRIRADPETSLELYTALSLARPKGSSALERRFLEPFVARHFGADYPDLDYVLDLQAGRVPANVRVQEFYLQSGAWLGVGAAQREYASLNYTHVAREVARRDVGVVVQLVARRGDRLSLSSNPDLTLDLLDAIARIGKPRPLLVCVVHPDLPFLGHAAEVPLSFADVLVEEPTPAHRLFALPAGPVGVAEYAIGLHASALVRDGGTLQIGIGALSDAIVHALLLRERDNGAYREALGALAGGESSGAEAPPAGASRAAVASSKSIGAEAPPTGVTRAAVVSAKSVGAEAPPTGVTRAAVASSKSIGAEAPPTGVTRAAVVSAMSVGAEAPPAAVAGAALHPLVAEVGGTGRFEQGLYGASEMVMDGFMHLRKAGILRRRVHEDLDAQRRANAGEPVAGGRYLHGGFFLGSHALYDWLRTLEGEDYDGLEMTRVSQVNELYGGNETLERAQRRDSRFFNTCMMQTLLGAAVSDALADGRVVSGVGGQYNFVAMAHALHDGRSVLLLRAVREAGGRVDSNVVASYGHTTIPRHLRDVVVTEYGIADLRGASDEECIERMLAISDARFVDGLAAAAKAAGKLRLDYRVPEAVRGNTPARLRDRLAPLVARGLFPKFPFGSDFDPLELRLIDALTYLRRATSSLPRKLATLARALVARRPDEQERAAMTRMALADPGSFGERVLAKLVLHALRATAETKAPLPPGEVSG